MLILIIINKTTFLIQIPVPKVLFLLQDPTYDTTLH